MKNMRTHKASCICCRREISREVRKCLTRLLLIPVLAVEIHASAQGRQMNAADMECSKPTEGYGQAVLGADFETGTFHRAQDADTKTGIFFNADGERQVGRFRLKGDFRFRQSFENGVRFASTFNPLRDMPYVIADSTGGNWQKQAYAMWADISTPIVQGFLNAGLAMDLDVGRGAKKVDPRPQAGMCRIEIKPSLSFIFLKHFSVSTGFIYGLYRETSNLILYDSSQPQKLYLLKGLGQYTYEVFSSTERERKYEGNTLGGCLSLQYNDDIGNISLYGEYRNGLEKVFDIDYNKPHDRGNYYTHDFRTGLSISAPRENMARYGAALSFEYSGLRHSGREFVQHFDSSPEVNSWVTDSSLPGRYLNREDHFNYSIKIYINDRNNRKSWVITDELEWNRYEQSYSAANAYELIKNARYSLGFSKFFHTHRGLFELGCKAKVSRGKGSRLDYTPRETEDTHIAVDLIDHDFALPSNWYSGEIGVGYTWKLKHGQALNLGGKGFIKDSGRDRRSKEESGMEIDNTPGRWWRSGCLLSVSLRF